MATAAGPIMFNMHRHMAAASAEVQVSKAANRLEWPLASEEAAGLSALPTTAKKPVSDVLDNAPHAGPILKAGIVQHFLGSFSLYEGLQIDSSLRCRPSMAVTCGKLTLLCRILQQGATAQPASWWQWMGAAFHT